jgi:hypothetical protein
VRESVGASDLTPSGGVWAYEVWGPFARWDRLEYIDAYVEKKRPKEDYLAIIIAYVPDPEQWSNDYRKRR